MHEKIVFSLTRSAIDPDLIREIIKDQQNTSGDCMPNLIKKVTLLMLLTFMIEGCGTNANDDVTPSVILDMITEPSQLVRYPAGMYSVETYAFDDDILQMQVEHESCGEHDFDMVISNFGLEAGGAYATSFLVHDDESDRSCVTSVSQQVEFDFAALKTAIIETDACTDGQVSGVHSCEIWVYGPHGSGSVQKRLRYTFTE